MADGDPIHFLRDAAPDFLRRAGAYLEGQQTPEELAELNAELADDPVKRNQFVRLCAIRAGLIEALKQAAHPDQSLNRLLDPDEATERPRDPFSDTAVFQAMDLTTEIAGDLDNEVQMPAPVPAPIATREAIRTQVARRRWPRYAAMIALPLLLTGALWLILHRHPTMTLASSDGAQWTGAAGPLYPGDALPQTALTLAAGTARVDLGNGVAITLQSPVSFQVLSQSLLSVSQGRLAVLVPHDAIGFTVKTPTLSVVDLGTEFGVDVQPGENQVRVQVFRGAVRTQGNESSSDGPLQQSLSAGEAVVLRNGTLTREVAAASTTDFLQGSIAVPAIDASVSAPVADASYKRWQACIAALCADQSVIACYTFDNGNQTPAKLLNRSHFGAMLDGVLAGRPAKPTWTIGRWPAKGALQFHGLMGELVALPRSNLLNFSTGINQTANPFTMSAWINVANTKPSDQIVICRGPAGADQYSVEIDGGWLKSWVGVAGEPLTKSGNFEVFPQTSVGKWLHVVNVYNPAQKTLDLYVNGRLVLHRSISPTLLPTPNVPTIGCRPDGRTHAKSIVGKIDELVIWSRPLSSEEIAGLYQAESPEE